MEYINGILQALKNINNGDLISRMSGDTMEYEWTNNGILKAYCGFTLC